MEERTTNTVIVGAGAAGLAVGACLKHAGVPFVILEEASEVGSVWRNHYDRLHLHTDKGHSALPYLAFRKDYPRYPSRDQVVRYLEQYADRFGLAPAFGERVVSSAQRNGVWETAAATAVYRSDNVVFCTGYARQPVVPSWPGFDSFPGTVLHSSQYRNGGPFAGRRALVVGFGNSGGEIAIDLCEYGAETAIAVRSPVNVIPRELFGIPVLAISAVATKMPARLSDRINGLFLRRLYGDITELGFRKLPYGPLEQVRRDRRVPLIDIGTIDLIRHGRIAVRQGIERFEGSRVVFVDGTRESYDDVILATGYRPNLGQLLPEADGVLIDDDRPAASGVETKPGLYFCGLYVSPGGMLQQISKESPRIAKDIAARHVRSRGATR